MTAAQQIPLTHPFNHEFAGITQTEFVRGALASMASSRHGTP
ncbi:hypothetical protein GGC64_005883 [Mycobacterium sp. OAS707]|nr:hypothetical protein [Mycobacterium sp. OAS707]